MSNTQQPVALITGASRRLGLHMTQSLLDQGWKVLVFTRKYGGDLAAIQNDDLHCIECNALDDTSIAGAIEQVKSQVQHLDLLLHNASIYEKDAGYEHSLSEFYDDLYAIHMKLPALLNYQFADLLKASVREQGNINHITDIYVDNPNPEYALYCSTKAGSQNLMISFAKQLAPQVRVNAIQPGPVKFLPEHSSDEQDKVLAETLLSVEGGFEALEKAIYAILDNHYMTASVVRVDGGRAMA